jgi:hypothetical protein
VVVVGKCRRSMTTRAGKNRVRIKLFMVCALTVLQGLHSPFLSHMKEKGDKQYIVSNSYKRWLAEVSWVKSKFNFHLLQIIIYGILICALPYIFL